MPSPVLSNAQRRLLSWGLVLVALVSATAIGLALARRISGISPFGKPAPPIVSQQSVVEQLRQVAKLVSVEMTLRDVVTYEQTQYRSTKRALLVVTARVAAGIDLSTSTDVRIDSAASRITVSLPPAQDAFSSSLLALRRFRSRPAVEAIIPQRTFADVILPPATRQTLDDALAQVHNHVLIFGRWGLGERHATGLGLAFNFAAPRAPERRSVPKPSRTRSEAVLFFDEADAIAARRSVGVAFPHQREAKTTVNVLLRELEGFNGVVIFATNLAANFDPAFERRSRTGTRCRQAHPLTPLPARDGGGAIRQVSDAAVAVQRRGCGAGRTDDAGAAGCRGAMARWRRGTAWPRGSGPAGSNRGAERGAGGVDGAATHHALRVRERHHLEQECGRIGRRTRLDRSGTARRSVIDRRHDGRLDERVGRLHSITRRAKLTMFTEKPATNSGVSISEPHRPAHCWVLTKARGANGRHQGRRYSGD